MIHSDEACSELHSTVFFGAVYLSVLNGNGPLEDHFFNVAAGEEINGSLRITSRQNVVFLATQTGNDATALGETLQQLQYLSSCKCGLLHRGMM